VNRRPPTIDPAKFSGWLSRLRAGDAAAAGDLVIHVTPVLRRVIRVHLTRLRLLRVIDPLDICQATLASFFARLTMTWPQAKSSNHLTALLVAIARNRIQDEARRYTAGCRDHRRVRTTDPGDHLFQLAALDPSPSKQVAWTELYEQALRRLTADERQLLEERLAGRSWAAIAADRRLSDEVLRQKLNRAVKRVRRQLLMEARETGV
jgi:RNA polymerase sigma factor (sigma-70 family)